MNRTSISWTDYSSNPLKYRAADGRVVWACEKLSPGCTHCYAEDLSHRYGGVRRAGDWNAGTMKTLTPFLDERELRLMLTYKPARGKRCFLGDMTDIFGEWVSNELLDRLFAAFSLRPDVTFQVLTKRAARMRDYMVSRSDPKSFHVRMRAILLNADADGSTPQHQWPLPNVWLGVSCEDQQRADERIPLLLQTPAALRFVSCEPLLGFVDLVRSDAVALEQCVTAGTTIERGLDWVIVGGESGQNFRACDPAWIRSIADQCQSAGVACFMKQGSGSRPGMSTGDSKLDALKQFPRTVST